MLRSVRPIFSERPRLFGELELTELEALARAAEQREFARDEVIFAAHEAADGLT